MVRRAWAVQHAPGNLGDARVQVLAVDPIVVGQVVFTDTAGRFSLPAAPCTYAVVVTAPGYQLVELSDVVVTTDWETTLEIQLEE